jgi:hypothetical protein
MGRKVEIRINYHADARFLIRVTEALEMDGRLEPKWKEETMRMAKELSMRFMDPKFKEGEHGDRRGKVANDS